jgi:uncharacterized membrane protein YhaH (DUF805 family)
MGFGDAVRSVFGQYARFTGRARRSELWFFELFVLAAGIVLGIVGAVIGTSWLANLFSLAIVVPTLAVGARRLHDTGRTGWWQLIALVPLLGIIVLIAFWVQDSHGDNAHGPSPKGIGGYAPSAGYTPPVGY